MEQIGILIGTILGAALKQCAPVLVDIGAAIAKRVFMDSAEVGKANAELQKDWNVTDNPRPVGVWDEVSNPKTGDSGRPEQGR